MLTKCIIQEKSSKHCLFLGKSFWISSVGALIQCKSMDWKHTVWKFKTFLLPFNFYVKSNLVNLLAQNHNICLSEKFLNSTLWKYSLCPSSKSVDRFLLLLLSSSCKSNNSKVTKSSSEFQSLSNLEFSSSWYRAPKSNCPYIALHCIRRFHFL